MMAAAFVVAAAAVYFGFVRKVNSVGPAWSMPATPVISSSAGTFSAVAPIDLAISRRFILQLPTPASGPKHKRNSCGIMSGLLEFESRVYSLAGIANRFYERSPRGSQAGCGAPGQLVKPNPRDVSYG